MRTFDTGATRDNADDKLHYAAYLSPQALERFAQYMKGHEVQADGTRRAPDNWKKGIPMDAYEDSMMRHVVEFRKAVEEGRLEAAEETMCAIMFNVQGWLHERIKGKQWGACSPVGGSQIGGDAAKTYPIPGDVEPTGDYTGEPDPFYKGVDMSDLADMDHLTQPENALAEPRVTKRTYEVTGRDIAKALNNMMAKEFGPIIDVRPPHEDEATPLFFEATPSFRDEFRGLWEARQQRPQPGLDPSKDRL